MENQTKPIYSVVIPTYNEKRKEKEGIDHLNSIRDYFTKLGQSYEIVIVLDGPTDGTPEFVKAYAQNKPEVIVIDRKENKGKGYSVREGLLAANGQIRLFTDMDGATPINMLDRMIPKFQEGSDIVIGSRDLAMSQVKIHQPKWKEWFGNTANVAIQVMTGLWGMKDTQCGFKAFTEKAVKDVMPRLTVNRWGIDFEILIVGRKLGYKVAEVPVEWLDRAGSLVGYWGYIQALSELFKVRWNMIKGVYKLNKSVEEL